MEDFRGRPLKDVVNKISEQGFKADEIATFLQIPIEKVELILRNEDERKKESSMENVNGIPKKEAVIKLSRKGWKEDEIAKAMQISIEEVKLIIKESSITL